jgi:hypothetical protein
MTPQEATLLSLRLCALATCGGIGSRNLQPGYGDIADSYSVILHETGDLEAKEDLHVVVGHDHANRRQGTRARALVREVL